MLEYSLNGKDVFRETGTMLSSVTCRPTPIAVEPEFSLMIPWLSFNEGEEDVGTSEYMTLFIPAGQL